MPQNLVVRVFADIEQYLLALREGDTATKKFTATVTVDAKALASAQVAASVKTTEAIRTQILAYRELAASAASGSAEQIAATRLASDAERRLAGSMAVSHAEATRLRGSASGLSRDLEKAGRGALSGSGLFRGLGRSLAFASGGFLAFAGAGEALRALVGAGTDAEKSQRQLAAQLKATGGSFDASGAKIEEETARLSSLSGFTRDDLIKAFTTLDRTTRSVDPALKDLSLTADIAAGTHKSLAAAALAVSRAEGGQTTALRRLIGGLPAGITGTEALALATHRFAGQAEAGATAQSRFGATLRTSEEIIGAGILPTFTKYLTQLTIWLDKQNRSGKLQREVNTAMHDGVEAVKGIADVLKILKDLLQPINDALGGTRNSVKLLFFEFLAFKAGGLIVSLRNIAKAIGLIGTAAEVSTGEVTALNTALAGGRIAALLARLAPTGLALVAGAEAFGIYEGVTAPKSDSYGPPQQYSTDGKGNYYRVMPTRAGRILRRPVSAEEYYAATGKTPPIAPQQPGVPGGPDRPSQFGGVADALAAADRARARLAARVPLTPAQQRALNLAEQPDNLRFLRDQQTFDRTQLAAIKRRHDAGIISNQTFIDETTKYLGDLAGITSQIRSKMEQKRAALKAQAAKIQSAILAAAEPLQLQVDLARETALGKSPVETLRDIIKSIRASLKNTKATLTTQKALWDLLAQYTGQLTDALQNQTTSAAQFGRQSAQKFAAQFKNLTAAQRIQIETAYANAGGAARLTHPMTPAFAGGSGASWAGGVTVNGDVHVHGVSDIKKLEQELTKRAFARAHPRRGAR